MTPTKESLTRPMFYEAVLPNGMKIAAQKLPHFRSVSLGVWVGTGTVKERPSEAGISHFIEHMLFKGTHSRTAAGIAAEMDRIGAVLNAIVIPWCAFKASGLVPKRFHSVVGGTCGMGIGIGIVGLIMKGILAVL